MAPMEMVIRLLLIDAVKFIIVLYILFLIIKKNVAS